jgi:hypothetical protein
LKIDQGRNTGAYDLDYKGAPALVSVGF